MAAQGHVAQGYVQQNGQGHNHGACEEDVLQAMQQRETHVRQQELQDSQSAWGTAERRKQLRILKAFGVPTKLYRPN